MYLSRSAHLAEIKLVPHFEEITLGSLIRVGRVVLSKILILLNISPWNVNM